MEIPFYQIDAFSDRPFAGNPAAVCPLREWLPRETMQAIAAEANLSETAFLVGSEGRYHLRWFTPTVEVELCGHATLASAFVLWNFLGEKSPELFFQTRSGLLRARREGERVALSLPIHRAERCRAPQILLRGLQATPREVWRWRTDQGNFMVLLGQEEEVRRLQPDLGRWAGLGGMGVIVTACGREVDFVSRYFAAAFGIPEDPVTGSSHSTLVPYWAERLGKRKLEALQVSARGGRLFCLLEEDHVQVAGSACCTLVGTLHL